RALFSLEPGPALRRETVAILKDSLAEARQEAERRLVADGRGTKCAESLSRAQDDIISALFDFARSKVFPAANPTEADRMAAVAGEAKAFIASKLAERDERHSKSGESRYVVEPDVKNGKGGLRDLHTLFWIAKFLYGTNSPEELADKGAFSQDELRLFKKSEDFLWAVRCHLHFLTGRGDDRLVFERQPE